MTRQDLIDRLWHGRDPFADPPGALRPLDLQGWRSMHPMLARAVIEHRPAVLHGASNHWNGLATVATANRLGIPSIYEVRGLWEVTRGSRDFEWAKGGMYRFMARMEADAAALGSQSSGLQRVPLANRL